MRAPLAIPIRVTYKGHESADTTWPDQDYVVIVRSLFLAVAKQPVVFDGDTPADKPDAVAAYFNGNASDVEILAPAGKLLRDIDWVAIPAFKPSDRTIRCRYAPVQTPGAPGTPEDVTILDTELALYDRRSGATVATKTFTGANTCPTVGGDAAMADRKLMRAWIRDRLKAGGS